MKTKMTANVCVNDIENLFMKRNSGNKGWNVNETRVISAVSLEIFPE